jgi:ribose-phosphate pyrophosphokinase
MADVLATAGAQRLIVVDPHTAALEAMCGVSAEMLTAVPVLAEALTAMAIPDEAILVAPDLGAVKLAEHYAALLHQPVALVRKTRLTGTAVLADEIIGTVEGRPAVIVDDMISTGGTIEAAIRVLLAHGATPDIVVAATHGLLVADAADRLGCLPIRRLIVTDTVMPIPAPDLSVQVRPVATLLAEAIGRAHQNKPLDDLMMRT